MSTKTTKQEKPSGVKGFIKALLDFPPYLYFPVKLIQPKELDTQKSNEAN